jgi:hypothetical protein
MSPGHSGGTTPSPVPTPTVSPLGPGVTPGPSASPSPTPTPVYTVVPVSLPAGPKIYVANHGKEGNAPSVTIFAAAASGDVAPLATLAGTHTNMQQIQFPGVDTAGNLYLSDAGAASSATSGFVAIFGPLGQSGNEPPSGSRTNLSNPEGIAFDSTGNVYVALAGEILVYPPNATSTTAPIRTLRGDLTDGNDIYGLAVDSSDRLYVAESVEVEVYAAGASGTAAPVQEFDLKTDPAAGLDSCLGIAVDSSANIYCANFNNSTITEYAAGSTGVAVVPLITASDPAKTSIDEPFGIFIDASNTIYVANYGNSSVAVFSGTTALAGGTATRLISGAMTGLNFPYGIFVR